MVVVVVDAAAAPAAAASAAAAAATAATVCKVLLLRVTIRKSLLSQDKPHPAQNAVGCQDDPGKLGDRTAACVALVAKFVSHRPSLAVFVLLWPVSLGKTSRL